MQFFLQKQEPHRNTAVSETWQSSIGSITFSVAELNKETKMCHFKAIYSVTLVDIENTEHGPVVGEFDIEQAY